MNTYCDFTELPTFSCSHCSGKELPSEASVAADTLEAFWDKRLSFEDAFSVLKPMADGEDYLKVLMPPKPEELDRILASNLTIQRLRPHIGRWNKTREVYGGNDSQDDFLDIERSE